MKISIITPCRNAEKYLSETIRSVVSQKGDFEIEYVIVDGGSEDGTGAIARKYIEGVASGILEIHCRKVTVEYLSERDEGMYDALSKGLKIITGDIVAYINSDDFYLPGAFSTVVDVFSRFPNVDWLTGMPVCYNEKGQITDTFLPLGYERDLIRKGVFGGFLPHIQQESTFWRAGLLRGIDLDVLRGYRYAGDFFLWDSFSRHTELYVVYSCLAGYRTRIGQLTSQLDKYEEEFYRIAEPRSIVDTLRAKLLKRMNEVLSNRYKRKWSRRLIYFKDGEWIRRR